jgi:hypothetical protein
VLVVFLIFFRNPPAKTTAAPLAGRPGEGAETP